MRASLIPIGQVGLYPYRGRSYWWLHSWLIDATGTLIDSTERDEQTRYLGVPWSWELLDAVNETPGTNLRIYWQVVCLAVEGGFRRCKPRASQCFPATAANQSMGQENHVRISTLVWRHPGRPDETSFLQLRSITPPQRQQGKIR